MTDLDGKSAARGGAVLSVLVQRVRCQVRVLRDDEAGCAAGMADWRVCQGQEQAGKGQAAAGTTLRNSRHRVSTTTYIRLRCDWRW
jgi:hypothetical protein